MVGPRPLPARERGAMRVQLVHWNEREACERAGWLEAAGFEVDRDLAPGPAFFRQLASDPPDAIVIDLGRLPSQGRDFGVGLRIQAGTRQTPLVFVGGRPDKIAGVQELLPDATYTSWGAIASALSAAIADPPADPVVPASRMAAYGGKPLLDKLGIRSGMAVRLESPPAGFSGTLGELPEDVTLHGGDQGTADLILWFVRSGAELQAGMERMAGQAAVAPLWIAWPKRAPGLATDLTQNLVRQAGLAAGLVDYKICSVDDTWSALLFTQRQK
jgi:hypothetical protein